MRLAYLVVALSLLPIGFSSIAKAENNPQTPLILSNPNSAAVQNYWTPERMRNAKDITLPKVDPSHIQITPVISKEERPLPTTGVDGVLPTVNIKPNNVPLFKPLAEKTVSNLDVVPQDSGSLKEEFSSSRLVPLSADQSYPYRAVGKLYFSIGSNSYVCSASVIRQRIVLTAGHCVHSGSGGASGFYTNFLFVPALRDGTAPYGSWTYTSVTTSNAWSNGGGEVPNTADYGLLEMKDQEISNVITKIGAVTGTLGWQLNSLMPNHVHMLGYPCNFDSCQKMHQVTAQSVVGVSPNNAEYGSDMGGGSSGGPWIQNFGAYSSGQTGGLNPGINRIVGVTSWGYSDAASKGQGASNLDGNFNVLVNAMCAHQAGNC